MATTCTKIRKNRIREKGMALPAVMLITFLLGTACVAMLIAAGANGRNTTDVLDETKAFYAAESGIQSAVNVLRYGDSGDPVNYKTAVNDFSNSGDLSAWLTYVDTNGDSVNDSVEIAADADNRYVLNVTDPDNTQTELSFLTSTYQIRKVGDTTWGTSVVFTDSIDATKTTTITWKTNDDPNATNLTFDDANTSRNTPLGHFVVTNGSGGAAAIDKSVEFGILYQIQVSGKPAWQMFGTISSDGAGGQKVNFLSYTYAVSGSSINLCNSDYSVCPSSADRSLTLPVAAGGSQNTDIKANIDPMEPRRLLLTSTGYGPNGGRKQLQAVIQKSPFNGMNSTSPFTMLGPCTDPDTGDTAVFEAGKSATTTYTGSSSGGVVVPAFAFTQDCNLSAAETWIDQNLEKQPGQVDPPPEKVSQDALPSWQRTPEDMDTMVSEWRAEAQAAGDYYNNYGSTITDPGGAPVDGQPLDGITFCDGDCTVGGSGSGILVVTGTLRSLGGFDFKGLILVTGQGGWDRAGGGEGQIIGNIVIAPYSLDPSKWFPPKYTITGGGTQDVIYSGLDNLFQGENVAATNFIRGVVEK